MYLRLYKTFQEKGGKQGNKFWKPYFRFFISKNHLRLETEVWMNISKVPFIIRVYEAMKHDHIHNLPNIQNPSSKLPSYLLLYIHMYPIWGYD